MFVITPTSGSAIRASSSICPKPAHAHLQHEHLGALLRRQHRQRQPDLGVEVRRIGRHAAPGSDQRGDQLLGRGLADRAGDADHRGVQRAPPRGRQPLQRQQRIVGHEHGTAGEPGGVRRRDDHAPRARGQRVRREPAPVHALADQPDEQIAGLDRARVDRGPHRTAGGVNQQRRPRRLGHLRRAPRDHEASPAIASRATAESSNGSLRPFSNSCPCSWPLPAMTTTSPGEARPIGAEDRRRAGRRRARPPRAATPESPRRSRR